MSFGGAPSCEASIDCSCAEFEGHAYWLCPSAATRAEAEARCGSVGMALARIDSQGENDHLVDTATARGVFDVIGFAWIGASDVAVPGEWRWSDGTQLWQGGADGMPIGNAFNNWTGGSPSVTGAKDCAGLLSDGTWQDRSCTAEMPAVCESP